MSFSLLSEACQTCTENLTGMPAHYARLLSWFGFSFGILLSFFSALALKSGKSYTTAQAALVFASVASGTIIFLGIAAGVYQPCPICKAFWTSVGLSVLVGISSGTQQFRLLLPFVCVSTIAVGITRFDATTALTIGNVLPQVPISKACDSSVLTPEIVERLTKGVKTRSFFLVVTRCSPCALVSLLRLAEKNPGWQLVVPDGKLDDVMKSRKTLRSPEVCEAAAKGTKANLVLLTIERGVVVGCNPNIEMNK